MDSICLQYRRSRLDCWIGKIPWRRKWQPTPVLLPGKSHGRRSLVCYSTWGHRVGYNGATSLTLFSPVLSKYKSTFIHYRFHLFYKIHVSGILEYVVFWSGFFYLVQCFQALSVFIACISTSFLLWLSNISLYGYMTFCLSLRDAHLSYFYCQGIVNNVSITTYVKVFVWSDVFISLGCMPKSRISGSNVNFVFNFLRNSQIVSKIA